MCTLKWWKPTRRKICLWVRKILALFNLRRTWRKNNIVGLLLPLSCIGIFILSVYGMIMRAIFGHFESSGTFGDTFGTLNTLFSGLAFAGILLSLRMQQEELKLQRKEMELQREEMKRQAEELKGQHEEIEKQRKLSESYAFERFFILMFEEMKESKLKRTRIDYANDFIVSKAKYEYENWCKSKSIDKDKYCYELLTDINGIFINKFKKIFSHIQKCKDENNWKEYYDIVMNDFNIEEKSFIFSYYIFFEKRSEENFHLIQDIKENKKLFSPPHL